MGRMTAKPRTRAHGAATHLASIALMAALFVLAKAGVIPMWVVTFGLSWTQLAMLTVGLMLVTVVAGVIIGRFRATDGR
jgi:hypothetical protein